MELRRHPLDGLKVRLRAHEDTPHIEGFEDEWGVAPPAEQLRDELAHRRRVAYVEGAPPLHLRNADCVDASESDALPWTRQEATPLVRHEGGLP